MVKHSQAGGTHFFLKAACSNWGNSHYQAFPYILDISHLVKQ